MKNFLAALALVVLAGCVTSPSQGYRPANYAGSPWVIDGSWNKLSGLMVIRVNGEPTLTGHYVFSGGELAGVYQGSAVASSCLIQFGGRLTCFVFVNGERAATLSF